VDHGVRPPLLENACGLERGLDRSDPAAEGLGCSLEHCELALGGGDDEHQRAPYPDSLAAWVGRICCPVPHGLHAQPSWLQTSDRVRLFSVEAGSGSTGVVLAHESPGGLCGGIPALPAFAAHGVRTLAFDFRGFPPSASPPNRTSGHFAPDLQAAVDALRADGARKVFVVGASFGSAAALDAAPKLHDVAGS
jgi:hypothetical protein